MSYFKLLTCVLGLSLVALGASDAATTPKPKVKKVYTAIVNANGTLAGGSATGSTALAPGIYEVDFGSLNVTSCAYTVTPGSDSTTLSFGFTSATPRLNTPSGVQVNTANMNGLLANLRFYLAVAC